MSYTTTEQVRRHVLASLPVFTDIIEQPVRLIDSEWVSFHTGPVVNQSILVLAHRTERPIRIDTKLIDGAVSLPVANLQQGMVLVGSDSSLAVEYVENRDYVVDCQSAVIRYKAGGQLAPNQAVTVWYRPGVSYTADQDYQTDSSTGRLKRLAGGAIGNGETVLLSYQPLQGSFPEDVIVQATDEANQFIAAAIDPGKDFGANPHLALAATYHAVAMICRIAATRDLVAKTASGSLASAWLALANTHQQLSRELIDSFRPPVTRPNQPRAV